MSRTEATTALALWSMTAGARKAKVLLFDAYESLAGNRYDCRVAYRGPPWGRGWPSL